jgi:hypothetical protein
VGPWKNSFEVVYNLVGCSSYPKISEVVVYNGKKNDIIVIEIEILNEFYTVLFMDLVSVGERIMNFYV